MHTTESVVIILLVSNNKPMHTTESIVIILPVSFSLYNTIVICEKQPPSKIPLTQHVLNNINNKWALYR